MREMSEKMKQGKQTLKIKDTPLHANVHATEPSTLTLVAETDDDKSLEEKQEWGMDCCR